MKCTQVLRVGILLICTAFLYPSHTISATDPFAKAMIKQAVKKSIKKSVKESVEEGLKKGVKKGVKESAENSIKKVAKRAVVKSGLRKLAVKKISKTTLAEMTSEQQELFIKKGYKEATVKMSGKSKALLISKEFDPKLKISRKYTGDWDPVKFHGNDSRFVVDGCETNLGRMKRGLAPLYKDPTNANPKWHGYSEFELHHGGQKADPKYFALMGKEHEKYSKILHTKNNQIKNGERFKSEIDRAAFSRKERAVLYKDLAAELTTGL